ncbi:MAG: hypothetical protein KBC73_21695 [Burkholderiaceae bacterium]|nr:hypothetical protein [Burkholderiaceae bacterium]
MNLRRFRLPKDPGWADTVAQPGDSQLGRPSEWSESRLDPRRCGDFRGDLDGLEVQELDSETVFDRLFGPAPQRP